LKEEAAHLRVRRFRLENFSGNDLCRETARERATCFSISAKSSSVLQSPAGADALT
jgi:hypothetical protein